MSVRWLSAVVPALSLTGLAGAVEPMPIGCSGVFGKQATRESIFAEFGDGNVTHHYKVLTDDERDLKFWRTYVFSPEVAIDWGDSKGADARQFGDREIRVTGLPDKNGRPRLLHYRWRTMSGVGIGTTIAEMEALNGKPFYVSSSEVNGPEVFIVSWDGGALGKADDGCRTKFVLLPDYSDRGSPPGSKWGCIICGKHRSDEELVRNWSGTVMEITVSYPSDVDKKR